MERDYYLKVRIAIDASRGFVDQPTGTERYSYELIMGIVGLSEARAHEFVLYVKDDKNIPQGLPVNVKVLPIRMKRLWTQLGLAFRTWVDQIDVLWVPAHTLPVLRKPGIGTVVTIHGIEYEWLPAFENKLQRWYLPLSTKYAVATANRVIAVSNFTKNQLTERLGARKDKITVIYEGYTKNSGSINIKSSEMLFDRLGIDRQQYMIFIGTVQPRKNIDRLVKAFSILRSRSEDKNLKLVIVGKMGWGYEDTLRLVNSLGLEEHIKFSGYISEAERQLLLHFALFYIQPSITEGFGLPILEAWSEGLAVASSTGGALSEIVGSAGLVFDPMNEFQMYEVMKKLVHDRKERDLLGKAGEKKLGDFSWNNAAIETLKVLLTYR